ncbi:MAG: hypothetical protein KDA87_23900, partial [Planctomycetales bacterium]|nr:hypothetical protein [Planctomycetales bacterium]
MSRLAVRQEIAKFKGRYRWRTALQWFTALGLFGTLLLIGIYWGNAHSAGSYVTAVNVVRAIVLAIAVGMVIQVVRLLPNDLAVARRIEFAFPDLKQRLLTAAEFPYARRLSYLQQSLIAELSKHAEQHRWSRLISNQQLFTWSMLAVVSMGVWVIVANAVSQLPARSLAATDQPDGDTTVTLMSQQGDLVVQVEPGNTEIEKGTPLLVFAKFPQRSPAACSLVVEDDGLPTDKVSSGSNETTDNADTGSGRLVIPMNPSLDDPLFGARLPEVIRPFTYKVVFDQGESETFRVTV